MKLSDSLKNFLSLFLRIGLSILLLGYLFGKMDTSSMTALLKKADFHYIYWAAAAFLIIHLILFFRWWILIKGLDLRVPFSALANYFFIGLFFNLFLPSSTGGDIIKTLGICKFTQHKAKVVASVVLDRLCGFIGIVIVAFFSFLLGYRFIEDFSLLVLILILALISTAVMATLFHEPLYSFCCRIFNRVPKIKNSLMDLHYDIVLLKGNPAAMVWAVLLSCLSQFILASTYFLFAKMLQQNIPIIYFFIFTPMICVVSSLPSIGGLGVRDAGAAHLFAKVGVASQVAIGITLMSFIFMVAVGLIGGVIYVAQLSPRRVQHHPSTAGVSPQKT